MPHIGMMNQFLIGSSGEFGFDVEPSPSICAGDPMSPPISLIGASSGTVTVAIGTNPSGGTLSGTLTQPVIAGTATFDDLSIDNAGSGYTLVATWSLGGSVTSDPFAIIDCGIVGCTLQAHGTVLFSDPLTGANESLEIAGVFLGKWFNEQTAFTGNANTIETMLLGAGPVVVGSGPTGHYGSSYAVIENTAAVVGGILQNNTAPNYGVLEIPDDTSFGVAVEIHDCRPSTANPGQDLGVEILAWENTFVSGPQGGEMYIATDDFGDLVVQGGGTSFTIDTLPDGEFYTMEMQFTAADIYHTCYFLTRSTDGRYLASNGTWVGSTVAYATEAPSTPSGQVQVAHLNTPSPGASADIPASAIFFREGSFLEFFPFPITAHADQHLKAQNLVVYQF